jgi:hypothetical protein
LLAKCANQHDHAFATGRRLPIQIAAAVLIQIVALQLPKRIGSRRLREAAGKGRAGL